MTNGTIKKQGKIKPETILNIQKNQQKLHKSKNLIIFAS
jgi:hypothetical protein